MYFVHRLMLDIRCSRFGIAWARKVIGKFMDSHRQPWVKRDIDSVLSEASIAAVREGTFIGLHVRRGDKLLREAKRVEVEVREDTRERYLVQ